MLMLLFIMAMTEIAIEETFNAMVEPVVDAYWAYEYSRVSNGY